MLPGWSGQEQQQLEKEGTDVEGVPLSIELKRRIFICSGDFNKSPEFPTVRSAYTGGLGNKRLGPGVQPPLKYKWLLPHPPLLNPGSSLTPYILT